MTGGMAVLTEKRHLLVQKLAVVAPVGLMTSKTIFFHRRMFPHERSSLFGVAFVTELIERIRFQHLARAGSNPGAEAVHRFDHKAAHHIMTA